MGAALPETTPGSPDAATAADNMLDMQLVFNLYPAWYAHPSWLRRLGITEADDAFQSSPLWGRSVSSALLRSEQLEQHFDNDFFDPAKRLALLDQESLTRLGGLVCATLMRERLKRAIRQEEVRALRACIGAEAHAFAVRWGGLLPLVSPPFETGSLPSAAEWQRAAVLHLFAALPVHAIGIIGRLRMRFPCDWPRSSLRLPEPQRVGFTRFIVAVLMQSTPQWRWMFQAEGEA